MHLAMPNVEQNEYMAGTYMHANKPDSYTRKIDSNIMLRKKQKQERKPMVRHGKKERNSNRGEEGRYAQRLNPLALPATTYSAVGKSNLMSDMWR